MTHPDERGWGLDPVVPGSTPNQPRATPPVVQDGPVGKAVAAHPHQVADIVATLSWTPQNPDQRVTYLQLCVDLAVRVIPGAHHAAITTHHHTRPLTTDTTPAAGVGVRSVLTAPLGPPEAPLGALTLSSRNSHGFTDHDLLVVLTDHVTRGLAECHRLLDADTLATQLHQAMETRAVIEQAKGILMAAHQVTAGDAFGLLRTQSQKTNTKLHDVAEAFLARSTGTPPPP